MLGRLMKKIKRQSHSSDKPRPSSNGSTITKSSSFGLTLLTKGPTEHGRYPVDIIAIHGLNGDALATWTHPNGNMWIRDLLPSLLPGCRVYTYGYSSQLFFNASLSRVREYAKELLATVRDMQDDYPGKPRSVIFVCHSLGGIVCKQVRTLAHIQRPSLIAGSYKALVFAHQDDTTYGTVLSSITGVVFLGTPHRGSEVADIGDVVGTIINLLGVKHPTIVNRELLGHLRYDSIALYDLAQSARNRLHNIEVASFYETKPIHPLRVPVVDCRSATIGLPHEDVRSLEEDHRDLCRFPGETESYKRVSNAIRRIACGPSKTVQGAKRPSTGSSKISLNSTGLRCISLLNEFDIEDYKRRLPKPARGTCQWIRTHPLFMSWFHKSDNTLLWLTGHPGCGKTILSYALAQYFEESQTPQVAGTVLVYFCDDKVRTQNNAKAILMSFIYQVVSRHRSLLRHVERAYEIKSQSLVESFPSLWRIFIHIIRDLKSGPLYIIIDAIDECEKVTCCQLLESIYELLSDQDSCTRIGNGIKFLITSRPSLRQTYSHTIRATDHISIDEGQTGYREDLRVFVQQRIEELCLTRNCSAKFQEALVNNLLSRIDQTFLWVHMIIESLKSSPMLSDGDIQGIIRKIPLTLESKYLEYLQAIPSDYREPASRLLHIILASSRPLSLDEINIAFTINPSHRTTDSVLGDCQNAMAYTIREILGSFVRILESMVSLVHQSVKDFLLGGGHIRASYPLLRLINKERAELQMSISCVRYLMLEDFSNDLSGAESSPAETNGSSTVTNESFSESEDEDLLLEQLYGAIKHVEILPSKYKFYNYASSYWAEHLARCETSAPASLREAAKTLIDVKSGNCRNWLRFYWGNVATALDQDPTNFPQLTLAAFFNLHETLKDILKQDVSQVVKNQALYWASCAGHCRIVVELLENGADPNARGSSLYTPLTIAAHSSHLDCVNALLTDSRTDPTIRGRNGRGALSFACSNGDEEMVKVLMNQGGCSALETDNSGHTPLFWAAGGDHMTIVEILLKLPGVDVNHRDKSGRTIVSWAACDGMSGALSKLLCLRDIDVNPIDEDGLSPLSLAACYGYTDAVDVLARNKKVDMTSTDKNNRNAISWACGQRHVDTLRVLLNRGCPGVDDEDVDGWTPLAWAVQNDVPEMVSTLVSTGKVDINHQDRSGKTALYWAVNYRNASVVGVLLRHGADPELASDEGETPAMLAATFKRHDILDELSAYSHRSVAHSESKMKSS